MNLVAGVTQPTVILEPKKIKSVTVAVVSPYICQAVMGPDDLSFLNVDFKQ